MKYNLCQGESRCCKKVNVRPKKLVLFPEVGQVKFFHHSPARIVECVSEYIFLISKNKQTSIKNKDTKKAKEKEEKRISSENRLEKINLRPPG